MELRKLIINLNGELLTITPVKVFQYGTKETTHILMEMKYGSTKIRVPYYLSQGMTNGYNGNLILPYVCVHDENNNSVCPIGTKYQHGVLYKTYLLNILKLKPELAKQYDISENASIATLLLGMFKRKFSERQMEKQYQIAMTLFNDTEISLGSVFSRIENPLDLIITAMNNKNRKIRGNENFDYDYYQKKYINSSHPLNKIRRFYIYYLFEKPFKYIPYEDKDEYYKTIPRKLHKLQFEMEQAKSLDGEEQQKELDEINKQIRECELRKLELESRKKESTPMIQLGSYKYSGQNLESELVDIILSQISNSENEYNEEDYQEYLKALDWRIFELQKIDGKRFYVNFTLFPTDYRDMLDEMFENLANNLFPDVKFETIHLPIVELQNVTELNQQMELKICNGEDAFENYYELSALVSKKYGFVTEKRFNSFKQMIETVWKATC